MAKVRFHLSTLIAVILTAGALLWMNLDPKVPRLTPTWGEEPAPGDLAVKQPYGWPITFFPSITVYSKSGRGSYSFSQDEWKPGAAILDALVAIGMLSCVFILFERRARRRTLEH